MCSLDRADCEHIDNVINQFDWTFTTDYCGTLLRNGDNVLQVLQLALEYSLHFNGRFQVDLGYPVPECLRSGFYWS